MQLDELEATCSADQARNRWPAETIFSRVTDCPALSGTIPIHFVNYVEQAHAVAYLNTLCCKFHVEPVGWADYKKQLDDKYWAARRARGSE